MAQVPFNQYGAKIETYSYDIGRAPIVAACKAAGLYDHAQQLERMRTTDFNWVYDIIRAITRGKMTVPDAKDIGQELKTCYEIAMALQQVRVPCYSAINYIYMSTYGEPFELSEHVPVRNAWPNEAGMSMYDTEQLEFINVATRYLDHYYQQRHAGTDLQAGDPELTKQMALNHLATPEQHAKLLSVLEYVVDEGRHLPVLADLL